MGKGRRNRERSLQDRLANPAAKNLKTKKKSGMPSWLTSVIAVLVVVVILLPLIISAIQESGFFPRHRILIESTSGEFDINQQMATFIAWESLYESGLTYYQYMQYYGIDIISTYKNDIYFTEVKYRKSNYSGGGLAAVTKEKQRQMEFAAKMFLATKNEFNNFDPKLAVAEVGGEEFKINSWFVI